MPYDYTYMIQNIFLYKYYLFFYRECKFLDKKMLHLLLILSMIINYVLFFYKNHGIPYNIHDIAPLTGRSNEGVANMKKPHPPKQPKTQTNMNNKSIILFL